MAEIADRFQPSFSLFPLNNNRTGYRPVNLPVILIVPFKRTPDGVPIGDSGVFNLTFLIEEAPERSKVAGFQNRGILVPQYERFRIQVSSLQLSDVKIDASGQNFLDQDSGQTKSFDEVNNGDLMEYTLLRGASGANDQIAPGVRDSLPFFSDADYYDLSPFIIETFDLPPGRYRFVWQCDYYNRIVSPDNELICIDSEDVAKTRTSVGINHPGEIHEAMRRNTPSLYFSGRRADQDNTIAFYRPFADALQDIFDEQKLLKGINWINRIPAQLVPYLAYLIGLDLPYFPSSTDNIRRALLRNGRRLQQLKGSQRAIRELFEIFGFTIDLANLWYSKDGSRFIAPNEPLPEEFADQEITTEDICHSEPLLNNYTTSGFGQVEIPLLFRPLGNLTIEAYLVESGSQSELDLQKAVLDSSNDVEALSADRCALSVEGFQNNSSLTISNPISLSKVLIDQDGNAIAESQDGVEPVINSNSIDYDFSRNSINLTLDHYFNFTNSNKSIYVFATYERRKIVLPEALKDLRSNRFDINVLTFKNGETPSSDIFEFLIEFLFKFKAFHSLLRKITFTLELNDVYNVQDFCLGGRYGQSAGTDLGDAQIPPAITPADLTEGICQDVPSRRGFKESDIAHRSRIRALLEDEHQTWKDLDGTHQVDNLPELQSLSRIKIRQGDDGNCEFTQFGQDRIIDNGDKDFDHTEDDRNKLCDLEGNVQDYCYKGRVQQDVETQPTLMFEEIFRCKPCTLNGGIGSYYMTPLIALGELSGGDPGTNAADLTQIENLNRSFHDGGYVRVMGYPKAEIHYSDRIFVNDLDNTINNRFFATRKPSLDLFKDNLFMPGHRFLSMANLKNDFVHPDYNLRPWDYLFDIVCPEDLPGGAMVPDLNARLVDDTNGNELLIFDEEPLIYYGNGVEADIPQMDNHDISPLDPNQITHSIWSSSDPGLCWSRGQVFGAKLDCAVDQINTENVVVRYPLEALGEEKDTICFTDVLNPLFKSANTECPCPSDDLSYVGESLDNVIDREETGTYKGPTDVSAMPDTTKGADFLDGYPASFGPYAVTLTDYDFPRETIEGYGFSLYGVDKYGALGGIEQLNLAEAIGIPLVNSSRKSVILNFKIGSGVRLSESDLDYQYYEPFRLDCGCEKYACVEEEVGTDRTNVTDVTGTNITGTDLTVTATSPTEIENGTSESSSPILSPTIKCPEDLFVQDDGTYDFNCDQLEINAVMTLEERYGAKTCLMDGSIPNMISFSDTKFISDALGSLPAEGQFQHIDEYGIIYIGMFEVSGDNIDITIQTRDPRIPGQEEQSGEVINRKVFRDGIISTIRRIIHTTDSGYTIVAEGVEQRLDRFQTSFGCGDDKFEDPFEYHLDFNIVDDLNIIVTPAADDDPDFGVGAFGVKGFGE